MDYSSSAPIILFSALPLLCLARKFNRGGTRYDPDEEYDFLVVGGGSAGCALAGRLSEDPSVSVLLVEAGGHGLQLDARIPAAVGNLQHTDSAWRDYCTPLPGQACTGLINGQSFWPRGKCLGGSSVLNYMAYVRGNQANYDSWASLLSDPRWAWSAVEKVFKRMEDCGPIQDAVNGAERGLGGPLTVSIKSPANPIAQGLVDAAAALGFATGGDYNGAVQEQAGLLQSTTKRGTRHSSADAYIWPVIKKRSNLHVVLHAECSKVLIRTDDANGPIATGVQLHLRRGSRSENCATVRARKEVIVSSSAVGSPKLLMLSGIGPREELQKHQIPCIADLPVGQNLLDHTMIGVIVNANDPPKRNIGTVNRYKAECMPQALGPLSEWLMHGTGCLASSAYDFGMFYKTGLNPDIPFPDIQLGGICGLFPEEFYFKNGNFDPAGFVPDEMLRDDAEGFLMVSILLHPYSKGSITLRSADYLDAPVINANYLADERDMVTVATGAQQCVRLAKQMGHHNITLPEDLRHHATDSLELWKIMARRYSSTLYHPTTTCAMGSVCDSSLRVKGIRGLRVADASVFPHITSGNTNAPSIMVGEMAAEFIKSEHNLM